MTYTVSSGTLNSTRLYHTITVNVVPGALWGWNILGFLWHGCHLNIENLYCAMFLNTRYARVPSLRVIFIHIFRDVWLCFWPKLQLHASQWLGFLTWVSTNPKTQVTWTFIQLQKTRFNVVWNPGFWGPQNWVVTVSYSVCELCKVNVIYRDHLGLMIALSQHCLLLRGCR